MVLQQCTILHTRSVHNKQRKRIVEDRATTTKERMNVRTNEEKKKKMSNANNIHSELTVICSGHA